LSWYFIWREWVNDCVCDVRKWKCDFVIVTVFWTLNGGDKIPQLTLNWIFYFQVFEIAKRVGFWSGLFYGGLIFGLYCSLLTVLYHGGSLVLQGVMTTGELTSFLLYSLYVGCSTHSNFFFRWCPYFQCSDTTLFSQFCIFRHFDLLWWFHENTWSQSKSFWTSW
jgi:hypothetical protein